VASFARDIRPQFRPPDVEVIKDRFDLGGCQDVRENAAAI
jgi:hypothetical protein